MGGRRSLRALNYNRLARSSLAIRELAMLFGVRPFRKVIDICREMPLRPELFARTQPFFPHFGRAVRAPGGGGATRALHLGPRRSLLRRRRTTSSLPAVILVSERRAR